MSGLLPSVAGVRSRFGRPGSGLLNTATTTGADMSSQAANTKWVNDDCERRFVFPLDHERAEGILKIHATCDPPCPRKQTAADYLVGQCQSRGA